MSVEAGRELGRARSQRPRAHYPFVRDGLGLLLVTIGLAWAVLMRDKLGLVVAFAGVTLLAVGVLRSNQPGPDDGKEPPIF